MRNGLRVCCVVALWSACGGAVPPSARELPEPEESRAAERELVDAAPSAEASALEPDVLARDGGAPRAEPPRTVGVRGITGSLTAFEVEQAMATRNKALLACVQQRRPRALGHVAGEIAFYIALDGQGKVERVAITRSDIGLASLEDCLAEVVATAPFPVPAGAERAETEWRMSVDPMSRAADALESAALEETLKSHSAATYESCEVGKQQRFEVTGYLGRTRKLNPVSVRAPWRGPARTKEAPPEQLTCVAEAMRKWSRWPKTRGYSKVTFHLHWVAPPPPPPKRKLRGKRAGRQPS